jgi:hypothetical protein
VIILDENLLDPDLIEALRWHPGGVESILQLAGTVGTPDEQIPALLRRHRDSIFVTNNAADFWEKFDAPTSCCIVAFSVSRARRLSIPLLLRRVFRTPEFATRAVRRRRMILVVLGSDTRGSAARWPAEAHYYARRFDPGSRGTVVLPEL